MAGADENPPKRGGRAPSAEEQALWEAMTRDVTPLPGRAELAGPAVTPPTAPEPAPPSPAGAGTVGPSSSEPSRQPGAAVPKPQPPSLALGATDGLDRRLADRFRRGRLEIEARLDLHGMTRAAAQSALHDFLARQAALGRRCLLVITGKGRGGGDGVLRREVPQWLNRPDLRRQVLAISEARPQHGGAGALYVLLRRPERRL